jgi:hypothetical protein
VDDPSPFVERIPHLGAEYIADVFDLSAFGPVAHAGKLSLRDQRGKRAFRKLE